MSTMSQAAFRLFVPDETPDANPVQEVVNEYLRQAEVDGIFEPKTLRERKDKLNDFAAFMGSTPLEECEPEHVLRWVDSHKEWVTNSTKRSKCNQVQACFNWAAKWRRKLTRSNPFHGAGFPESEPRRPITWEELRALLRKSVPRFRRFLIFLWWTGCRAGEASDVAWQFIDWTRDAECIVLAKHKNRKKTKKPRYVVLLDPMLKLLCWMQAHPVECGYVNATRQLFNQPPPKGDGDMVKRLQIRATLPEPVGEIFRNEFGRRWAKETLAQKIDRLRTRAKLPKDVVLHCIRHACGTKLVKEGRNIKFVSMYLGHQSVSTTERYYVHLDREAKAIRDELQRKRT
jgi:integrase